MVVDRKREVTFILIGFKRFETLKFNINLLILYGFNPNSIYVYVDGLINGNDSLDLDRCEFKKFCENSLINSYFQESNLGLKNHFLFIFNQIVNLKKGYLFFVEDDVKITLDFLLFSYDNLNLIDNKAIVSISSVNHCSSHFNSFNYITQYQHSWGWVTHVDYIKAYLDFKLHFKTFLDLIKVEKLSSRIKIYWLLKLIGLKFNFINSWAYRWQIYCMINDYRSLVPAYSLCEVNGSDKYATNTEGYGISEVKIKRFDFKGYTVKYDQKRDEYIDRIIFSKGNFFRMILIPVKNKILKLNASR